MNYPEAEGREMIKIKIKQEKKKDEEKKDVERMNRCWIQLKDKEAKLKEKKKKY